MQITCICEGRGESATEKAPPVTPVLTVAQPVQLAALEALANSASFRKAPALPELLLHLCEHRESPPSEYDNGIAVLSYKEVFDLKPDSAVGVHMSRLRARL